MAWTRPRIRTSKPEPHDHVTFCPLCGIEIWVIRGNRLTTCGDLEYVELAVRKHLSTYHQFRYGLWTLLGRRTSWPTRWLITGLWR